MSELQAALLVIGFGVIAAVYAFGWWQQRKYRKKFSLAFKASHADALYIEEGSDPQNWESHPPPMIEGAIDEGIADEGNAGKLALSALDEPCALLDVRSDYIIELRLKEASSAAALDGFWQRKFDFGKLAHACGLPLNSTRWERAISESQTLYSNFRVALQMVDRGGAISAAKLADFRDLILEVARRINADAAAPDIHEAHRRALELDSSCAEVDQMVGINLVASGGRLLLGSQIAQAADLFGMKLESDGAFHLPDARGWQGTDRRRILKPRENDRRKARQSLFSLVNLESEPFRFNSLETVSTAGVTLLLDLPRIDNPAMRFEQMVRIAQELANELQADLVDDNRVLLSEGGLARIRERIVDVEAKMIHNGIAPGSAQARRLFS